MYSLGIDIGTASVVAAVDRGSGAEVVALGETSVAVPAAVYRHQDGTLRTGDVAARRAVATPHRVATGLVRRLVDGSPVVLGDHPEPVAALLAAQLRDVLATVGAAEGADPTRIALSRPASWGGYREDLLAAIPAALGWDDVAVVSAPLAAAAHHDARCRDGEHHHHHHRHAGPRTVAVYDLGAGGFEATVCRVEAGVPRIVRSPESIEDLDGVLDGAVVDLVDAACGGAVGRLDPRDPHEGAALARLLVECAAAREALSGDTEVLVPVLLGGRHRDVEVRRAAFEERIAPTVDATVEALGRTLRDADTDPAALDAVLLVGGAARTPLVARTVTAALGRPVQAHPRAAWAVALGTAGLAAAARVPSRPGPATVHDDSPTGPIPVLPPDAPGEHGADHGDDHGDDQGADPDATVRVAPQPVPAVPEAEVEREPEDVEQYLLQEAEREPEWEFEPEVDPDATIRVVPEEARAPEPDFRAAPPRRRTPVVLAVLAGLLVVLLLGGGALWWGLAGESGTQAEPVPPVVPAAVGPGPATVAASVAVPRVGPTLPGPATPGSVVTSPNGRLVYAADPDARAVTVADARDPRARTSIPIPAGTPRYLAVAADGRRAYVSVWDEGRPGGRVVVLDTVTRTVVATVPVRSRPFAPAASPDGATLWVPDHDAGAVAVVDTARGTVVREVGLGASPHWAAFSPDGSRVYVSLEEPGEVVELDPGDDREVSRVPTGAAPYALAVHPTRPLALSTDRASGTVTAFDTLENAPVATIGVGRLPQDVAWAPDGRFAYVVDTDDAAVSVIDATTLRVTATLRTPPSPTGVAVAPDGRTGYVTCAGALAVLELAS